MHQNLSVVIPTHGSVDKPLRLIECLSAQITPEQRIEVLVVSNTENLSLKSELSRLQDKMPFSLTHLTVGALGSNRARNLGLRSAQAEVALFLDDDCLPMNTVFFDQVLNSHRSHPEFTAIGGGYLSSPESSAAGRIYNWISNDWLNAQFEKTTPTTRLIGGCVSYKTAKLKAENLWFDEEILYGGAETEFHERLLRAGHWLLFDHRLWIQHDSQISLRDLWKKAVLQGGGKTRRTQINHPSDTRSATIQGPAAATYWRKLFRESKEYRLYRLGFSYGEYIGRTCSLPNFESRWSKLIYQLHLLMATPASQKPAARLVETSSYSLMGKAHLVFSQLNRLYYWLWRSFLVIRKSLRPLFIQTRRLASRAYWLAYHIVYETLGRSRRVLGLSKKYAVIGFWRTWESLPLSIRSFARTALRVKND